MSYTVIGDVVNVAARLQGEARAAEVLITGETYTEIADDLNAEGLEARELQTIQVKGRFTPVTMYNVTALRAQR